MPNVISDFVTTDVREIEQTFLFKDIKFPAFFIWLF